MSMRRTTLEIDDDVLAAAKLLAEREHRSARNGIPLLPSERAASPVTLELVNQLRDEEPLPLKCSNPLGG
jgi:hypothetical protein